MTCVTESIRAMVLVNVSTALSRVTQFAALHVTVDVTSLKSVLVQAANAPWMPSSQ